MEEVDKLAGPQLTVRSDKVVSILKSLDPGLSHHVHQDVEDKHVDGLEAVLGLPVDPVDDAGKIESEQGLYVGAHQIVGVATSGHNLL